MEGALGASQRGRRSDCRGSVVGERDGATATGGTGTRVKSSARRRRGRRLGQRLWSGPREQQRAQGFAMRGGLQRPGGWVRAARRETDQMRLTVELGTGSGRPASGRYREQSGRVESGPRMDSGEGDDGIGDGRAGGRVGGEGGEGERGDGLFLELECLGRARGGGWKMMEGWEVGEVGERPADRSNGRARARTTAVSGRSGESLLAWRARERRGQTIRRHRGGADEGEGRGREAATDAHRSDTDRARLWLALAGADAGAGAGGWSWLFGLAGLGWALAGLLGGYASEATAGWKSAG